MGDCIDRLFMPATFDGLEVVLVFSCGLGPFVLELPGVLVCDGGAVAVDAILFGYAAE